MRDSAVPRIQAWKKKTTTLERAVLRRPDHFNVLVFVDLILLPAVNLFAYRLATAAISMALLLYGLIWESS